VSISSQSRPVWTAAIAVPLLFASISALQVRIDARTRTAAQQKEELLFRSDATIKKLSLGYESLAADIYWTRAIQYYGTRVGTPHPQWDLLWPLLDITTALDPHLIVAYRFGAIFLSETGEGGAGRTDLAVELVKRGIAANPDEWRLYTDLGFLYYWRLRDYTDAAATYVAGSKVPNAPLWVKLMAARIADKGGSIETSRMIWSELYDSTKDPNIRKYALQQLRGLKAQQDEEQLDELAEQYRNRFGHYPASTQEMRAAGILVGIPVDPAGFAYAIGADGKFHLDPASPIVIPEPPKTPPVRTSAPNSSKN
jgi:hypothetical protein